MRRLLSIGECMLELSPAPEPGMYRSGFAGDTFNTAWYARRLAPPQIEIVYMTAIGEDEISRRLERFAQDAGIVPQFTRRDDRTIGLYMIELVNGERSFSYWRSASAARTLADDLVELPGLSAGDLVYFSGITLAILPEAGRQRLFAALGMARAGGVRIAFDPNLRPRLWPSGDIMKEVVMQGAALADIALPSFADEAQWFGDADIAACAARYRGAGCEIVAVKDGPAPVLVEHPGGSERVEPENVEDVVDTTAAGDAFNAAFLIGVSTGLSPADAARQGCRLSARVIRQPGALCEV
jgi:2-dehydro-3-deoxygluconokinase